MKQTETTGNAVIPWGVMGCGWEDHLAVPEEERADPSLEGQT